MTSFRLQGFGGLIPRLSKRLLPDTAATTARNTKLLSGELRGFRALRQFADFTGEYFTVRRAYRIPPRVGYDEDTWLTFDSRDVDIVRSPIVNDRFDRYYWAGDGRPQYNTFARIANGQPSYYLGIPVPDTAPVVTPPGAGSLSRAYVYTFVSAYGEEGPPSEPTLTLNGDDGTWALSGLDTTPTDSTHRNIATKRIYRTVPGNATTVFFFVDEIPLAQSTYNDSATDDVVALNDPLQSTSWVEPPTDLEGFVSMPNGYLVGWAGRRLVFSEPYRPHAWPAEYELATEFEIVGLVVWGSTLIIGTKSNPYIGQGVTPAAFTMQKMDAVEPCLSRRGMVATVAGAYYPSINGLILANSNGTQVITQDLLTKEEWARYNPGEIYAAQLGLQYIAFNGPSFGFVFNPTEQAGRLVELDQFDDVVGIETDRYTGNVFLLRDDRAFDWDPEEVERLHWRWKSREFHLPKPANFSALKIKFETAPNDVSADTLSHYGEYNNARFAAGPLDVIGMYPIDGVLGAGEVPDWTEPENMEPIGGSPLYPIEFMSFQVPSVRFIAYANAKKVMDRIVRREDLIRMPAGFKADIWQFEMVSNTIVYSVQIAETGKELKDA
jgi:hypothetical protein